MKKIGIFIFISLSINLYAQDVEFKSSNFKDQKEAFKKMMAKKEQADAILDQANEAIALVHDPGNKFKRALKLYLELHEFNPNSSEVNRKIANCYLYTNEKYKAKPYIEQSLNLNKEQPPFFHFLYGQVLQLNQQFDDAIKEYKIFEETAKNKHVEEYKKITAKYKTECKNGKTLIQDKKRVWVDNVQEINSSADDYSPCLSADGEVLMFTSNRKNNHPPNDLDEYDSDIYISEYDGKSWSAPKNAGTPLNSPQNEVSSALSYDGQRLLLWKTDENNISKVYESKLNGRTWSEPQEKMSYIVSKEQNNTYACYEPQDIKIYYVTDKRGNKNIDFSGKMAQTEGKWGRGVSAGHTINTKFHEGSVYIHPNGKTMYFSSQGHNSMGGYDIFVVHKNELEQWTEPINLGYPINTPYDDMFFAATANGKYAYIASNRDGGKGGMDIYKVTFWGPEKPLIVDTEDFLIASKAQPIKNEVTAKPVQVEKNSLTVFKGRVIDAISRQPVEAEIEIVDNAKNEAISKFTSNSATGKFLLSLPAGKNYGISVKAEGYLFHSENFNLPDNSDFNMVHKDIELKNIKVGSKIALRNIFFATGKADLTPESNAELDRLVKLMQDVPSLKIEISGHTDNTGSEALNRKLSQARAEAVMNYLKSKGIAASRMVAKGYGSTKPIDTNDTPEGRQNNRRTEIEIIGS